VENIVQHGLKNYKRTHESLEDCLVWYWALECRVYLYASRCLCWEGKDIISQFRFFDFDVYRYLRYAIPDGPSLYFLF
jgi:hypothetical protein